MPDNFLDFYTNELAYLRQSGKLFAAQHPKIAQRLELSDAVSPDPHTEHLLESFAFLTAKLNQQISDRFPEISAALLGVLYPHLTQPLPAMSIAQFRVDPSKGKLTTGYRIPKGTNLFTYAAEGALCRFQTSYDVTLWPLQILDATVIPQEAVRCVNHPAPSKWFLKLTLKSATQDFSELDLENLTFHLRGEHALRLRILESIFKHHRHLLFATIDNKTAYHLGSNSVHQVGLDRSEMVLPVSEHTTHAHQLLQEYFHFPDKFLFFRLSDLHRLKQQVNLDTKVVSFLIPLHGIDDMLKRAIHTDNFELGCTPIVNLFKKTTEPQRLTHRKSSYPLIADKRRDRTTEIHSIQHVFGAVDGSDEPQHFSPYFSFDHSNLHHPQTIYWAAKRIPSLSRGIPGTDIQLSFVDLNFNPTLPPRTIFYAQTLCTNRFLAEQLPTNATLQIEEAPPVTQIICLDKPTPQQHAATGGETLWRLISQLSVNHLRMRSNDQALQSLKETLKLYIGSPNYHKEHEIDQLCHLQIDPIVRRLGKEAWRGFVEGLRIKLSYMPTSDERFSQSPFLLGSVLQHYFSLNVSINGFIELALENNNHPDEVIQWPPSLGSKTLL